MPSFTLNPLTDQNITWNLVDANNSPISGATVTATLYANRDKFTPSVTPGTPDTILFNLAMPETPSGSGIYVGSVPEAFNPAPAVSGYITVILAKDGSGNTIGDYEVPTVVTPPQNTIDFVTLSDVKSWMGIPDTNTSCDRAIQLIITSLSQYILNRTGRSSFKSVVTYSETYDGNGNQRMFLNNFPIQSVTLVQIGLYAAPLSTAVTNPGIFIEQQKKSIAFRNSGFNMNPPLTIYPGMFMRGVGNVLVNYTAGYSAVPYDLQEIVIEAAAQQHKRQDWIDLASKAMSIQGSSGTTRYRDWMFPPYVEKVIQFYSRYARP